MPGSTSLNIPLNSYRGTPPEITLTRFFLARAKVLSVLMLNTHLIRKDEWYGYQSQQVLWNGSASKNAKLRIGRAYGKAIGNHCVKLIHDLSAADPFSEITRFAMFEFGQCNLWIWTLQYLCYLLYWTVSVLWSQLKQFIRVNRMSYIAHTLIGLTFSLYCLITNGGVKTVKKGAKRLWWRMHQTRFRFQLRVRRWAYGWSTRTVCD